MALSTSRFSILIEEAFRSLIERVQRDGTCWLSGTIYRGRSLMRISVSNWSTTSSDVRRSAEAILAAHGA